MDDETAHSSSFSDLSTEELRGRIMLIALSVLFIAVIFVLLLHLYARLFWWRVEHRHQQQQHEPGSSTTRHHHGSLVFATGQDLIQPAGLDPFVLRSIPVMAFKQKDFKNGLECSVCLSELIEGEKARVLPNCNHGFHVDCIDMWFQSHSTCPLCRNRVGSEETESVNLIIGDDQQSSNLNLNSQNSILNSGYSSESSNFPSNILIWGDQNQVSSTGAGSIENNINPNSFRNRNQEGATLVINVPENVSVNSLSSSSSARFEDPKSPVSSRLRSLKRLLSREKRTVISSSSSSAPVDV